MTFRFAALDECKGKKAEGKYITGRPGCIFSVGSSRDVESDGEWGVEISIVIFLLSLSRSSSHQENPSNMICCIKQIML